MNILSIFVKPTLPPMITPNILYKSQQIYSSIFHVLGIKPLPVTLFENSNKNPDFHTDATGMCMDGSTRMISISWI